MAELQKKAESDAAPAPAPVASAPEPPVAEAPPVEKKAPEAKAADDSKALALVESEFYDSNYLFFVSIFPENVIFFLGKSESIFTYWLVCF